MFGLGMPEMIVIGVIAILVVGPKDLPKVFKGIAALMRQLRGLSREFQGVVNDMIRESELDDLAKEAKDLRKSLDPTSEIRDAMRDVEDEMRETENEVASKPEPLWKPPASPLKPKTEAPASTPEPAPAASEPRS